MKIYILKMIKPVGYDEYDAKVVCARDETVARELANAQYGDEGDIWEDKNQVTCNVVEKKKGVVLASFNAA